jgi:hypothetical protein
MNILAYPNLFGIKGFVVVVVVVQIIVHHQLMNYVHIIDAAHLMNCMMIFKC